ncbi:hypothetical protein FF1_034502 [Malus domestica]
METPLFALLAIQTIIPSTMVGWWRGGYSPTSPASMWIFSLTRSKLVSLSRSRWIYTTVEFLRGIWNRVPWEEILSPKAEFVRKLEQGRGSGSSCPRVIEAFKMLRTGSSGF